MLKKGYSKRCIKRAFNRASVQNREELLYKVKPKTEDKNIRFITRYSKDQAILRGILSKYWCLLCSDDKTAPFVSTSQTIVLKRSSSIRDNLVHNDSFIQSNSVETTGIRRCGPCKACTWLSKGNDFVLPNGRNITLDMQLVVKQRVWCTYSYVSVAHFTWARPNVNLNSAYWNICTT